MPALQAHWDDSITPIAQWGGSTPLTWKDRAPCKGSINIALPGPCPLKLRKKASPGPVMEWQP